MTSWSAIARWAGELPGNSSNAHVNVLGGTFTNAICCSDFGSSGVGVLVSRPCPGSGAFAACSGFVMMLISSVNKGDVFWDV